VGKRAGWQTGKEEGRTRGATRQQRGGVKWQLNRIAALSTLACRHRHQPLTLPAPHARAATPRHAARGETLEYAWRARRRNIWHGRRGRMA